ncbi:hypothetical protein [Zhihengliuella flava]|uniref:Uncharacterized protein n=1 Tax=Zhihengliuella flava TaxID=1285193 RepID=A0A931D762_9MICC|nr:hypothetical protein [Zhihengliuella flava]MBG6083263.1 hypothetical protein [Zhihengliuella flava]
MIHSGTVLLLAGVGLVVEESVGDEEAGGCGAEEVVDFEQLLGVAVGAGGVDDLLFGFFDGEEGGFEASGDGGFELAAGW